MTGFLKFGAASAVGFLADLALALVLHEGLAQPLWLAATVSFFAVALINYLLFEFWVFRRAGRRLSPGRALGVLMASTIAALVRIGTILVLQVPVLALLGPGRIGSVALLAAGAGLSLVVNYAINRGVVFAEGDTGEAER